MITNIAKQEKEVIEEAIKNSIRNNSGIYYANGCLKSSLYRFEKGDKLATTKLLKQNFKEIILTYQLTDLQVDKLSDFINKSFQKK